MNTIEYIKMSLENGSNWAMGLISDMKDAPMTQPTPNGGNHPLWVLGHLVHSESNLFDGFVLGKPNRFPQYEGLFSMGGEVSTDESKYPSMDELLASFQEIRGATLAHLETLSEEDLDKKANAPEEMGAFFGTVGACYAAIGTHMMFHAGQVADARRAAKREPLMA